MTDVIDAPHDAPTPRAELPIQRRSLRSRVSRGHVLAVLAAMVAGGLNIAVLSADDDRVEVLTAATDLRPGTTVDTATTQTVRLGADPAALDQLITASALGDGLIVTAAVPEGALLTAQSVAPRSAGTAPRAMSIPLDVTHAVGGDLRAGDLIDVIAVGDESRYLLQGARVLADPGTEVGGLGGGGAFHVTIAVDADSALQLAEALSGTVHVVRTTGALGGAP